MRIQQPRQRQRRQGRSQGWRHGLRSFVTKHVTKRRLLIAGGLLAAFLVLTPIFTYLYYARDIADQERLMNRNSTGVILRDREGEVFYKLGRLNGEGDVPLSQVNDIFEEAVIASEDRNFYQHEGYSLRSIAVALYSNILDQDATRYGGSTITQQLVKNKLLTDEKSYLRKYQELSLAIAIERRYTKDEILEMYLNSVYFGEGAFGVNEAAKRYFGKSAADLTLAESSLLVGLLPAPSAYSPISGDAAAAEKQQQRVLDSMAEAGFISRAERDAALQQELAYNQAGIADSNQHAQHFAMMVLDELNKEYGEETVIRGGYDVTTTLDLEWQKTAEQQVREQVARQGDQGARNAGLVAMDPRSGEVRALVGSVDWNNPTFGKVNMALAERQPGSSFKPIFYAEAIEQRLITPATMLEDRLQTYGSNYRPTNYDHRYRGEVTVRSALALSMNVPAVEVMQKLGVDEASQAARDMGISTVTEPRKYGLSLALGTAEVKLYEMVQAYTAFANQGDQHQPVTIRSVKDKYDNQVFEAAQSSSRRVLSSETAYLISSILSDNQARAPTFGNSLTIPGRQVAVKTGTTNDNKDAWTIGYTPSAVVGVWMGNNENEPMRGLAGSSSAGVVWRNTMRSYLEDTPRETFRQPSGVVSVRICADSGLRAASNEGQRTYEEVFIRGTEPTRQCNIPKPKEDKPEEKEEKQEEKKKEQEKKEEGQGTLPEPTPPEEEEPPADGSPDGGGRGGNEPAPSIPTVPDSTGPGEE